MANHGTPDFFYCRVGFQQDTYTEQLSHILTNLEQDIEFISAPIRRTSINEIGSLFSNKDRNDQVLPDLVLPNITWQTRVCVELEHDFVENFHFKNSRKFNDDLAHALYLTCPSVMISLPETEAGILSAASVINQQLAESVVQTRLLFKIPLNKRVTFNMDTSYWPLPNSNNTSSSDSPPNKKHTQNQSLSSQSTDTSMATSTQSSGDISVSSTSQPSKQQKTSLHQRVESPWTRTNCSSSSGYEDQSYKSLVSCSTALTDSASAWLQWNLLRQALPLDHRIGIALELSEKILNEDSQFNRWTGEPVRILIIPENLFIMSNNEPTSLRLPPKCKSFIKKIIEANSMNTNLLLRKTNPENLHLYLSYLNLFITNFKLQSNDILLEWNDKIQAPLQPLSSNLDSSIYSVFETDRVKYEAYGDAMKLAIEKIISRREHNDINKNVNISCNGTDNMKDIQPEKELILMVLGAGRGPLVDSMIHAVSSLDVDQSSNYKFRIYALDKNPSSVISLKYKLRNEWAKIHKQISIDVVHSDMRDWHPNFKADLIASELLGSLADNELSPECIDGAMGLAKANFISIPQEYSSHIAPICSQKLRTVLQNEKTKTHKPVFDQIYVCRLSNYFMISAPQKLFTFEHRNWLDPSVVTNSNQRYQKLSFYADTDTVCHGFAGFFTSTLFADVTISTLIGHETEGMFSWFPTYIPLEEPIQLQKGTRLDLHFWRKESNSSVWYEWIVTNPTTTRIHGHETVMSKFI